MGMSKLILESHLLHEIQDGNPPFIWCIFEARQELIPGKVRSEILEERRRELGSIL